MIDPGSRYAIMTHQTRQQKYKKHLIVDPKLTASISPDHNSHRNWLELCIHQKYCHIRKRPQPIHPLSTNIQKTLAGKRTTTDELQALTYKQNNRANLIYRYKENFTKISARLL